MGTLTRTPFIVASKERQAYVKAISSFPGTGIIIAIIRHMWHAIRQQAPVCEDPQAKEDEADLDDS